MATFKIEQFVAKIKAPVVCKIDDGELAFESGSELAEHTFEKYYLIESIEIDGGKVVLKLRERNALKINSVGEEIVPEGDWLKEHKERFGVEPNLFDGA